MTSIIMKGAIDNQLEQMRKELVESLEKEGVEVPEWIRGSFLETECINTCPKCGGDSIMPTGDGNMICLCGNVWKKTK